MDVVLTYTEWMLRVDLELMKSAAVSHHDLPNHDYRAEFEAGGSAEQVAESVLAAEAKAEGARLTAEAAKAAAAEIDSERMAKAKAADERIAEQLPPTKRRGRRPTSNRRTGSSGESEGG